MAKRVVLIIGVPVVVAVGVGVVLWFQEAPLRQAKASLDVGLVELARALEVGERPDRKPINDAYHQVTTFLESHPAHTDAIALQARILVHMDRADQALQLFEEVGADEPAELLDWARAYMKTDQFEKAVPFMERVLKLEPTNVDALYEITTCRMQLGAFNQALESAGQFAALPGMESRGRLLMAAIHTELANRVAAIAELEAVLKLEPEGKNLRIPPEEFFYLLGAALHEEARAEEAMPHLLKSLELARAPKTYVVIGKCHRDLGDEAKAEQAWKQALEIDVANIEARELLSAAALARNDAQAAVDWISPIAGPGLSSTTAYQLQRAYLAVGNAEQADVWQKYAEQARKNESMIDVIDNLLKAAPTSMWGCAIRAHRAGAAGDWKRADELVEFITPEGIAEQPFLAKLVKAVEAREVDALPRFEELPINLY